MDDCVFCKILNGESDSEKVIYENGNFFSISDAHPVTDGHSLVISKKHSETILDIQNVFGSELLDCIKNTALKIIKENNAEGFNVVNNNFKAAGQVVNHVHVHVIPRKKGDGLKLLV